MQTVEEVGRMWEGGALVIVKMGGQTSFRAAAFVFGEGDMLTWVEPHYLDPYGAATPAMHSATVVDVCQIGNDYNILGSGGEGAWSVTLARYIPEEDADQIGTQIKFLFEQLAQGGKAWKTERRRIRRLIFKN